MVQVVVEGSLISVCNSGGVILLVVRCGNKCFPIACKKDDISREDFYFVEQLGQGDYIKTICEEQADGLILTKVVRTIRLSQTASALPESQQNLLIAYSWLLRSIRHFLDSEGFVEVRPPSIHFGIDRHASIPLDFFGLPARLTSSNALYLNIFALHLCRVFSLQPCFRAESFWSNKHLAEFDLLEIAWLEVDLETIMDLLERMLKQLGSAACERKECAARIREDISRPFRRLTYDEIAEKYGIQGKELGRYERQISEDGPVFVVDFPIQLASWSAEPSRDGYAKSFNLLMPQVGEVAEGSAKETRIDLLNAKFANLGMGKQLGWYSRHFLYPGCRLAGFGLGVNRLAMWLFGVTNIRRLNPFFRDWRFSEITL